MISNIETKPKLSPRRPFDSEKCDGYLESDNDYVLNNLDLVLFLLEREEQNDERSKNATDNESRQDKT